MSARRLRFEDYEVDLDRRELRKSGQRIKLQHKPFRILESLLRRPGELITREELCHVLWPDSHVSFEHSLNAAVSALRLALGESSRLSRLIETRSGIGYRFCARVEELVEEANTQTHVRTKRGAAVGNEDYLKGRYLLDKMCEDETYKAIAFFKSAAKDETCIALGHAGVADAYCQLALLTSAHPSTIGSHARSAAEMALRYGPESAEAHLSAGRVKIVFDWDWKGAQEASKRAETLDARSASAYVLQSFLMHTLGHHDSAQQLCRQAVALDPLSTPANLQLAACLYASGHFEEAADQCWKILTLTPRFAPAQILLALAYQQLSRYEESLIEFRNAQLCPGFEAAAISGIGQLLASTGLNREAEEAFLELGRHAQSRYVSSYWYALICAGRDQREKTFFFLDECASTRDPALLSLRTDFRLNTLRDDARFEFIANRLGVQA